MMRMRGGPPVCHPDRRHEAHGLCATCYQTLRYTLNPEKRAAADRAYQLARRAIDPGFRESKRLSARRSYAGRRSEAIAYSRRWRLERALGITEAEYDALLVLQDGLCAICRQPETTRRADDEGTKRLSVDHGHVAGRVRGLVCQRCNTMLGMALDDPQRLRAAAAYLEAVLT